MLQHNLFFYARYADQYPYDIPLFVQACHIRKRLLCSATKWESTLEDCHKSDLVLSDWFRLVEDSKQSALADFDLLSEKILEVGWASKNILLSTKEQARYSFVDDRDR